MVIYTTVTSRFTLETSMKHIPFAALLAAFISVSSQANDLESYAKQAQEKAADVAGDVSDWSKDKYQDAKEAGADALDDATEWSKDKFEDAKEAGADALEDAGEWSKDKLQDAKEAGADTLRDAADWAEEKAKPKEKPWWKFWE